MTGCNIQIDKKLKEKIDGLAESMGADINRVLKKLIEENTVYRNKLDSTIKELQLYKERELEAFVIGDALYDGIHVMDKKGIIVAVNKAFTKMTGVTEEEIIGQSIQVLVDKKLVVKPVGMMVLEQKKQVSSLATINDQKVVVTGNPIFNEQGEVVQVLTVMRDVTELIKMQKQLEYSEKLSKKYLTELNYFRKKEIQKSGLIGQSQCIHQIRELVNQVAQVDVTVLITGETGSGKEVVAREIFKNSPRKNSPYVKVNCAAIPETLLESELFGYEKGAFTGALNKEKLGLFEIANLGTILLDEIGEMPMNLQTKLLRVLQEKEIFRIGGTEPIKLDVRVIAATNQQLEQQVKDGNFREDLYYRLNVIPIRMPPLRSRPEDISLLADHFLKKYNEKYGRDKMIDVSAIGVMEQYQWPGNVRELENMIERLVVVINEPVIDSGHIIKMMDNKKLSSLYFDKSDLSLKEAVELVERQMIEKALAAYGSTHKAARILGVSQPTVVRKAKELGITNN